MSLHSHVKTKLRILSNFMAFSEYMNFTTLYISGWRNELPWNLKLQPWMTSYLSLFFYEKRQTTTSRQKLQAWGCLQLCAALKRIWLYNTFRYKIPKNMFLLFLLVLLLKHNVCIGEWQTDKNCRLEAARTNPQPKNKLDWWF